MTARFLSAICLPTILALTAAPLSAQTTAGATQASASRIPERPVRRDIPMTRMIQRAFAAGTRDSTGRPGRNYWQLWNDYKINASLDPTTSVVTGRETVTIHNNSDSVMRSLVLRLDQNFFAPNVPRLSPAIEITDGMQITRLVANGQAMEVTDTLGMQIPGTARRVTPLSAILKNTSARITLPTPIAAHSTGTLEADWHFRVPHATSGRAPAPAQQAPQITAADYARAERFLRDNVMPLVSGNGVQPSWLGGERFWYRSGRIGGADLIVVDPTRALRSVCTPDTERCGAAIDAREAARARAEFARRAGRRAAEIVSPDGRRAAFIRAYNLWVRDVANGRETKLTTDGAKEFGYATDNAGWIRSDNPILLWSPDSRKIATFQQDERGVGEMYLVNTKVGHPELQAWKYPLPGDSIITTIQRVIIDVDAPRVIRLQMPADQHRSTLCDHVICRGDEGWTDVQWYPDGSHVAFVSTSRDHKKATLRVADAATGAVRDVMGETVATQYESGNGMVNWRVLPASNEVIWFSERDDWGQLYLYDLVTGALKSKITSGEGNVAELLRIDEKNRTLYFVGNAKERGRDPYFRHFYRIGMDGKSLTLLTPENADHSISLSPSGRYFVDTYSKPDVPQTSVLRDLNGKTVITLEKTDISRLLATGWKPPRPIIVKARDGKTDLYGLMYTPTNLDSTRKYPFVNHIYPGPQTGSVGGRSFSPARGDAQALAELGFVVVEIDGMGTPWRSKSFHDAYYGRMGDNTLPDQVAGMKELAGRYSWIDLNRVGIYGHSGGGFAAADAMFRYPDFFKVGISEAGNHDNRVYEDDWGERYQGLLVRNPDGTDDYTPEANQVYAKNLKGKLLLAHGTMDDNVPPYNTLLVVNELIKANKDFDLILLPNRTHGFGNEPYMIRRRWDYFVKNLLGAEPPKEYEIKPPQRSRAP